MKNNHLSGLDNKFFKSLAKGIPGLLIVIAVLIARLSGNLEILELAFLDLFLRTRTYEPQDDRFLLIEIDKVDIDQMGNPSHIPADLLINLVNDIQQYKPNVIGFNILTDLIDPADPDFNRLSHSLARQRNVILAEKTLPPFIYSVADFSFEISSKRVGFVDIIRDQDSHVRRTILGLEDIQNKDIFKFSFSTLLAEKYLEKQGYSLENGIIDETAMRFGETEVPRFYSNTGGYINADRGGIQTLLNYRFSQEPFNKITYREFQNRDFKPSEIESKIVIIGVTDPRKRQSLITILDSIGAKSNLGTTDTLEISAHATSQIVSAVLDNRLLIHSSNNIYDYVLILFSGILSVTLWIKELRPRKVAIMTFSLTILIVLISYWALINIGLWIALFPSIFILGINFLLYSSTFYYRNEQLLAILKHRSESRRKVIHQTFDIIHNGPLQKIAITLNQIENNCLSRPDVIEKLKNLSQEIQDIGNYLKDKELDHDQILYLTNGKKIDLLSDAHELFYQVYSHTLENDFPSLKNIKLKIRSFEPLINSNLRLEEKGNICRFLEEAICNVGKHAVDVTCIQANGYRSQNYYILEVKDNGKGNIKFDENKTGEGTRLSRRISHQLNGDFKRFYIQNKGTICQLRFRL